MTNPVIETPDELKEAAMHDISFACSPYRIEEIIDRIYQAGYQRGDNAGYVQGIKDSRP